MRALLPVLAAAIVLVAIAPSANATDFCWWSHRIAIGPYPATAYIVVDAVLSYGYLWSIWAYAESNGRADLQRGGSTLLFGDADVCQESNDPDTAIF